jgi:hypothetical protein
MDTIQRYVETELKDEVNHVEKAPLEAVNDPKLVTIAEELDWARSLSQEDFNSEQAKLVRKVRLVYRPSYRRMIDGQL